MKTVTASAPGKLMLMGDHAVVYDRPCIVTAVDQRMRVTISKIDSPELQIQALDVSVNDYRVSINNLSDENIPKNVHFIQTGVYNFFNKYKKISGLKITTKSDFSALYGFGSSSAVTVATIKSLSKLFEVNIRNKELFDLSFKTVIDIQKKGSGFDVAAAVYGGTLYYKSAGLTLEKLNVRNLPILVGYTGVKADTVKLIKKVAKDLQSNPNQINKIFDDITNLVDQGKKTINEHDYVKLGKLFSENQILLTQLGVSTDKINLLNQAVLGVGAYGAKLSGAGGGDCIITLYSSETREKVIKAINKYGTHIPVSTNAEGVRIE